MSLENEGKGYRMKPALVFLIIGSIGMFFFSIAYGFRSQDIRYGWIDDERYESAAGELSRINFTVQSYCVPFFTISAVIMGLAIARLELSRRKRLLVAVTIVVSIIIALWSMLLSQRITFDEVFQAWAAACLLILTAATITIRKPKRTSTSGTTYVSTYAGLNEESAKRCLQEAMESGELLETWAICESHPPNGGAGGRSGGLLGALVYGLRLKKKLVGLTDQKLLVVGFDKEGKRVEDVEKYTLEDVAEAVGGLLDDSVFLEVKDTRKPFKGYFERKFGDGNLERATKIAEAVIGRSLSG